MTEKAFVTAHPGIRPHIRRKPHDGLSAQKGFFARSLVLFAALAVFAAGRAAAQEGSFARGEALFMQNDPQAALPLLEAALAEDPANIRIYEYLAIVYLQLERPDDAIAIYMRALARGGTAAARLAFNLGNTWFGQGNWEQAIRYYGEAIEADRAYAPAWLNRANARVRAGALREAAEDYRYYLSLENHSPQRARIEGLLAFIDGEFAAAERRRAAEEERAREEAERQRQEAERRRQLLEEVSASLQASAGETQGLSAGSESVQGYDGEFELE